VHSPTVDGVMAIPSSSRDQNVAQRTVCFFFSFSECIYLHVILHIFTGAAFHSGVCLFQSTIWTRNSSVNSNLATGVSVLLTSCSLFFECLFSNLDYIASYERVISE
jgi:hypothetical protein